jgi:hypothetical protein
MSNQTTSARKSEIQRRRYEKTALSYFDSNMPGRFKGRSWARERIRRDPRPLKEAKRLVDWFRKQGLEIDSHEGAIDFSAVQELRVKIIRKHGFLDTTHNMLFQRMERLIAKDEISQDTFETMAAAALAMKPALPTGFRWTS